MGVLWRMGEAVGVWTMRHCAPGPTAPSQCWRNPSKHLGDSEAAGWTLLECLNLEAPGF